MEINYQQNGPDGKMEAEEVEAFSEKTSIEDEIGAAAMEEEECETCGGEKEIERTVLGADGEVSYYTIKCSDCESI